jgi:tryptophan synthase alpha chain
MGVENFADRARSAGVDGVLVVDYPPEEAQTLVKMMESRGLDTIFLLSPTTTEARMRDVARLGRGYLYYVSLRGVTGAANIDVGEVAAAVRRIAGHTSLPIGVGFGIRDGATARAVADVADAVVIGSRLVQEIEASPRERVLDKLGILLKDIRDALDAR